MRRISEVLADGKGRIWMGPEPDVVPPLVIQGLTDLVLDAALAHGLAPQALQHNPGFGLGIPSASVPG
jgi:hypothetical protein